MRIREEIVQKHWREAAVDELANKYLMQGYEVDREASIGPYRADLLVKKGDELVVFEVKSGDWSTEKTKQVQKIRHEVVHRLGGKFNLVLAAPPQEKTIEVEGIETILLDRLRYDPQGLSNLATTTTIENVSDIVITAVAIEKNYIRVEGSGTVTATLHWATNAQQGATDQITTTEGFPFEFRALLDGNLQIIDVVYLKIDTSSVDE